MPPTRKLKPTRLDRLKSVVRSLGLAAFAFSCASLAAAEGQAPLPVTDFVLDNGLQVVLLERRHSPTVACQMAFKVGSNNERSGVTGSAHMLEHMMFKGTNTIGTKNVEAEIPLMKEIDRLANLMLDEKLKGDVADASKIAEWTGRIKELQEEQRQYIVPEEITRLYSNAGADGLNAYTSSDYTNYICKLPANKLELWCWLESDRIANPVFREFYAEKEVVREERRMRHDTNPEGALWELFNATLFQAHPYRWMVIGWTSDIENYRRETMEEFFTRYYAPNNAVIVWVGDFDTDEAKALITKYFGGIPSQPESPPVTTREAEQKGERRAVLEYDANASLLMGWPSVSIGHPDQAVFEVLEAILSEGRTSRLYERLRQREQKVSSVLAYAMKAEYPGFFLIGADPLQGIPAEEVEAILKEEVEKVRTEKVSDWELQRVKNKLQSDFVGKLESNYELARDLAEYECKAGWELLAESDRRRQAVTAEDVLRVAKKYLVPGKLSVATLKPTKPSDEPASKEKS